MEQYGKGPANGNWKSFPKCPFCGNKSAGLFPDKSGVEFFKCHHVDCPTGKKALEEVGFLAQELGLNRRDAAITFLKQAGVWQEADANSPSIMPGQQRRKNKIPLPPPETDLSSPVQSAPHDGTSVAAEPSAGTDPGEPLQPMRTMGESREPDGESTVHGVPPGEVDTTASSAGPPSEPDDATLSNESDTAGSVFEELPACDSAGTAGVDGTEPAGPAATPPTISKAAGPPSLTVLPDLPKDGEPPKPPEPPGPTEPPDDENVSPSMKALRWFYARLHWSDADQTETSHKRGLTRASCEALGYRSNPQSNKELLLQMAEQFPPAVLVDCGLWSDPKKPGNAPAPNAQFYGMSLVPKRDEDGKKVRDEDGKPLTECVWNHPILIPYFDEHGDLIHLRPHKGMMSEKSPRFYVARPSRAWKASHVVEAKPVCAILTEGEFKAGALWQVLGGQAVMGALPGITMAKMMLADIEEWLDSVGDMRQVVIAYDNEEKGDPKLPGYQEKDWQRYDAQVYARFLAKLLNREGYDAKVCVLPKEWRDEQGKADWDGALAHRLNGSKVVLDEAWPQIASRVRGEWLQVLKKAQFVQDLWQTGFFEDKEERLIKNALERISYEDKLPIGGHAEEAIAKRLKRLVAKLKGSREWVKPSSRGFLMMLAKRYEGLKGGYYILKPLRDPQVQAWTELLSKASDHADVEVKRACELVLNGPSGTGGGIPERISDFYMEAHYVLNCGNGIRDRLVRLYNIHGAVSGIVRLPSSMFAQPSKFREWLLNNIAGAAWRAGERELQDLHADMGHEVSRKDVAEVALRGYHEDSKCWFFKDVTFDPGGQELRADRNEIVWFDNQAYKLGDRDVEDQPFCHLEPRMHPDTSGISILKKWGMPVSTEEEAVMVMFQQVSTCMYETLGSYSGWMTMGIVFSFAAAPEIFSAFGGFPCLWIHGEPRQGKTSVARWMMRVWGFLCENGLALLDSTKVGMSIALQQYGNLPVWFEEFQANMIATFTEKLKNIFDRTSGNKKVFEGEARRKILTGAIVTGVATSPDAQLKSRFAHVQVASANRVGFPNHFDWFQDHANDFYVMGRFLMRNRKVFARAVVEEVREWLADPEMKEMDPRARTVHGVAYAAFVALEKLLPQVSHTDKQIKEYRRWLVSHCREAVKEAQEQVNVDLFWRDLLDALADDVFGETPSDRRRIFKVIENPGAPSPVTEEQARIGTENPRYAWKSWLCYFRPGPVIDMLRRYKRSQGRDLPLDQNDLRAQMRTRPYWKESKHDVHRQKFEAGRSNQSCWCIDFDKHDLGFRPLTDEEFQASHYKDGVPANGEFLQSDEWVDPRKGDLFALMDALRGNKSEP